MSEHFLESKTLFFRLNQADESNALVKQFHYSGRHPSNVVLVGSFHLQGGLFGDLGEAVAAVFFSIPPSKWKESVIELSRLVRKDSCKMELSRLISIACKHLKMKGHDLVVSFADPTFGHHGGVYQSCSWNYHGRRCRSIDGLIIDGNFVPGRTCNHVYGTRSAAKLSQTLSGHTIEPHYDQGKHLYWRALNRSGEKKAARLGLQKSAYPKPEVHTHAKCCNQ